MFSKLLKVLILLFSSVSYAAPPLPSLPADLPKEQETLNHSPVNEVTKKSEEASIFTKIKQFFYKSEKSVLPQTQIVNKTDDNKKNIKSEELAKNEDPSKPFIDLGSTKLPSIAHEHSSTTENHETNPNLASTDAENQAAATPFIDLGNTKLPSLAHEHSSATESHETNQNLASAKVENQLEDIPATGLKNAEQSLANASSSELLQQNPQSVNLASNESPKGAPMPVTANVPMPLTTMPPAPPAPQSPIVSVPTQQQQQQVSPVPPNKLPPITSPVVNNPVTVPPPPALGTSDENDDPLPVNTPQQSVPINNNEKINTPAIPNANTPSAVPNTSSVSIKENWDTPLQPVEVASNSQNQASLPPIIPKPTNAETAIGTQDNKTQVTVAVQEKSEDIDKLSVNAAKFAKDETQMLLLPNDDIVLGKLTKQAKLDQMDMYSYIKIMQKKEQWLADKNRRKIVKSFIQYDENLNKKKNIYSDLSFCDAIKNAFNSVQKNNLFALRALLDIYPILQEKNQKDETLLNKAIDKNDYYLAKFLIIRGIKISSLDSNCQYPVDIAIKKGYDNITCMLEKATNG